MRKNEDFREEYSRSSASSRSSSSSESSSDEEEKGIECFLENDQLSVEKELLPVENDQLPVEPEVKLTDCKPLVLGEIDSESDDELNDQESLPVTLDKPEFTSEVEFILSPTLAGEELNDATSDQLPVNFRSTSDQLPEANHEPEIELIEKSSLVMADNESSSGQESEEESDNSKQLPVLTFIQKLEPEILKITEADCEEDLYPFVPTVDEFNNLVQLPASNFKLSSSDEPEVSVEQLEVESVGGPSLTARKSERKSSTDDELTDSKSLLFFKSIPKPYSKETPDLLEKPEVSGSPEVANSNEPIEPKQLPILSFFQITDSADDSEVFDDLDSMTELGVSERSEVLEKPEMRNADEPSSSAENGSCTTSARFFARCQFITFPLEKNQEFLISKRVNY